MKTLRLMLALAAVAMVAVACDNDDGGTPAATDTVSTTDTVIGDAADDTTTPTDTITGDTAADAADDATTTTGGAGCTSTGDQAYLGSLGQDQAKAKKFEDDVKACTLANAGAADEATAKTKIGKCLVDKGHGITETCGGCYGVRGYCTFKNCVQNAAEAATANCIQAPTGDTCTACANKYGCIQKSEDCKAGK